MPDLEIHSLSYQTYFDKSAMKSAGQKNTTVFSLLFIFCFPCYKNTPGFGFIFFIWLNLLYIKRTNITICAFCQCRHYKSLHAYLHIPYVCLFDWEEHTLGIASKISRIFTLLVRYFMPMYVPFANISVLLCFQRLYFCGYGHGICTYITLKQCNYFSVCTRVLCCRSVKV